MRPLASSSMKALTWHKEPELNAPVAYVAFSGWSDAADAASGAVQYLIDQSVEVEPLATISGEGLYDFSQTRPETLIIDGINHGIEWPAIQVQELRNPAWQRDLVVVTGPEPEFKWSTVTDHLVDLFHEVGASGVFLLGAFIGRVAHTLPVPIMAVGSDPEVFEEHELLGANYQGPTGIVGVLNAMCTSAGFPTVGLWAAVPHYLAANPNPRAMLALLKRSGEITGAAIDLSALETDAIDFHQQIEAAVSASVELADYVAELENDAEDPIMEPEAGERLATEIERFLREPD